METASTPLVIGALSRQTGCNIETIRSLAIFNQTGADGEFPQFTANRRLAGEGR